jgi:hypothetical protein
MKRWQFFVVLTLSSLCLVLALTVTWLSQASVRAQLELQRQQDEINRGNLSQQVGGNILREMAAISVTNSNMKDLLARNGYNVAINPAASNAARSNPRAPASSPKPGAKN